MLVLRAAPIAALPCGHVAGETAIPSMKARGRIGAPCLGSVRTVLWNDVITAGLGTGASKWQ